MKKVSGVRLQEIAAKSLSTLHCVGHRQVDGTNLDAMVMVGIASIISLLHQNQA